MNRDPICRLYDQDRMSSEEEKIFDILFSKKSRQRLEKPDVFTETHYPIEIYHEGKDKPITEEEFFERVYKKSSTGGKQELGTHCSIIIGNNGVGKSELCAYVKVKLEEKGYEKNVLYIDKYESLKSIISEKIPKTYEKLVGKPFEPMKDSEFMNLGGGEGVYSGEILSKMLRKIDETHGSKLVKQFNNDEDAYDKLKQFITEGIEKVYSVKRHENPIAHDNEIFHYSDIKEKPWLKYFSDINDDIDEVIDILDNTFDESVYEMTKTPSISQSLKKLSDDCDETIWIIFEDYDLRPLDNKKLIDFIESNTFADIEFVIAMTPDREKKLEKVQTGTFRDRNHFYRFEEEGKGIPFFNEDTIVDFIRPFISYLKNTPKGKIVCENCGKCSDDIIDLYPFSTTFLKNLYTGFKKEPTPRKYVELISDLLDDFRINNILPFISEDLAAYKINADIPLNLKKEEAFVRWYYNKEENNKNKIKEIAKSLDLDETKLSFEWENNVEPPDEPDDNGNKRDLELQKLKKDIRNWLLNPSDEDYSKCNSYVKQGISFIAKALTEDWRIDNPWTERKSPQIYYHISRSEEVLFEKDDFSSDSIFIPLELMTHETAKSLLDIGYKASEGLYDDFEDISKEDKKNSVALITNCIKDWRKKIIEEHFDVDLSLKNSREKKLDDLIAFSVAFLSDLSEPFNNHKFDHYDSIINDEIKLNEELIEYFDNEKGYPIDFLNKNIENILELFRWRYSLDGENLNLKKYDNHSSSFESYFATFSDFKKTEVRNTSNMFRIGKTETKMGNLLEKSFDFVDKLNQKNKLSKEGYIKPDEIEKFYENAKEVKKDDFNRISTLSYLEGTDILANIQSFEKTWNDHEIDEFLNKLNKYKDASSIKKDFQNIVLKRNYFYNFYKEITNTEMYKKFKDEDSHQLSEFLDYLEKQNEVRKKKEKQEKAKNMKKEIKNIYEHLKTIKDLDSNQIERYQVKNLEEIDDLSKLENIKTNLLQKKEKYFDSQEEKLEIFKEYEHFFEDTSLINQFEESIESSKDQLSKKSLQILIKKRQKLEKKFESIFDFINSENRYKLAKENKVILTELSREEIEKLKKSDIKNSLYLVIKS